MHDGLYIGLMSGTSADAIDAALVSISTSTTRFESAISYRYPDSVRSGIIDLCTNPYGALADLCQLEQEISTAFAQAANALLETSNVAKADIQAIGSHGQTIIHQPTSNPPFTLQLSDTSLIAHLTGIDTVADFRRADLAAGGQGAPLVPAFHASVFGTSAKVVLNLGGIANVTILNEDHITGFDTGPANTLLDAWCRAKKGTSFDQSGDWARTGKIDFELLEKLLADSYFSLPPPKSSGPDYFSLAWLSTHSGGLNQFSDEDVQATLTELTAVSIAKATNSICAPNTPFLACGGGVQNTYLLERLAHHVEAEVALTSDYGVHCEFCEAMAFAWLAYCHKSAVPGNVMSVTGASRKKILGALYPAS